MPDAPKTRLQRQRASRTLPPSRRRESACKRGYTRTWKKLRDAHLHQHPLCRMCKDQGRLVAAECVDHIKPISGRDDPRLLDQHNLQALCLSCHNVKTGREKRQ